MKPRTPGFRKVPTVELPAPPSLQRKGPNAGHWVVVATLGYPSKRSLHGVPLVDADKGFVLYRFPTADDALAATTEHGACRVGGGWLLNLRTGETVPFTPNHSLHPVP